MATRFSQTFEGEHDAIYEYCCTPCAEDKLNAEASFYCRNCRKLFCDICIGYHDKVLKDHQVLGKAEVARWGKVKAGTSAMMCEEHPDKEEEMYCVDHDLTCCHICVDIRHRACTEVRYVSEVAKELLKTSELQSFLTNAACTQRNLRNLLDKRTKNIKLLQKTPDKIMLSFKEIRESFNQSMDNVEKETIREMDRLLSILQSKAQSDADYCSDFEKEIQKFLDDIENVRNQSNELAFLCLKRCARKLSSAEEFLSSIKDEDYHIKYIPDASIQQFQSSLKTFGKFSITSVNLPPDYVYTVEKIQTHNVRTKTDTQRCIITGMSQLPGGQVAVVDNKNKKVKLLSSTQFSVLAELVLPPCPWDICTTTGTKLVVTVCSGSKNKITSQLLFINAAGGQLTQTTSKILSHLCDAIAYHQDQLYVGSHIAVYEYSLSGQKLRKIYKDKSSQAIIVARFAVSDDGNRIYVTNYDQSCITTIHKSGQQLSVFTDPELQGPCDICVADNGTVFVCGTDSHSVTQVDSEGKRKMVTLAKQSDGVNSPWSLCYDRKLKQLLLGQGGSDNLLVLKLK